MKKLVFLSLIILILSNYSSYSQITEWAEKIAGTGNDYGQSVAVDGNGNIYVGGYFSSEILTFNNGISLNNSGKDDGYIAKYNKNGVCEWAEKIGGENDDIVRKITLDDSGNIYVTGNYVSSTLKFNNNTTLSNSGNADTYLAKYNSNGECQWVEKIAGTKSEDVYSIAIDSDGNLFLVGNFTSPIIYFNNGFSITNIGGRDGFLVKYNNTGECQWVENIEGDRDDFVEDVSVDSKGNVYVVGHFWGDGVAFNNYKWLPSQDIDDCAFLAKYSNDGICQWAEGVKGDWDNVMTGVAVDNNGNVYVTGWTWSSDLAFNNGISIHSKGRGDSFVAKYNSDGECEWAEGIGGGGFEYSRGIAVDKHNDIYAFGVFSSLQISIKNLTLKVSEPADDVYIAKFKSNGECEWAESLAGKDEINNLGLDFDTDGNVYLIGNFKANIIYFNNNHFLTNTNKYSDIYLAKYSQTGTSVTNNSSINDNLSLNIFPNPTSDNIEISLTTSDCSNTTLKLYDMSGRLARDLSQEMTNSNSQSLSVNLSTLTSGEYTIILTCGNEKVSKSVVVVR